MFVCALILKPCGGHHATKLWQATPYVRDEFQSSPSSSCTSGNLPQNLLRNWLRNLNQNFLQNLLCNLLQNLLQNWLRNLVREQYTPIDLDEVTLYSLNFYPRPSWWYLPGQPDNTLKGLFFAKHGAFEKTHSSKSLSARIDCSPAACLHKCQGSAIDVPIDTSRSVEIALPSFLLYFQKISPRSKQQQPPPPPPPPPKHPKTAAPETKTAAPSLFFNTPPKTTSQQVLLPVVVVFVLVLVLVVLVLVVVVITVLVALIVVVVVVVV